MRVQDYYNIELKINKKIADIGHKNLAFTLSDSIYSPVNSCNMSIYDVYGYLQEAYGFASGIDIDLTFGVSNYQITNNFFNINLDNKTFPTKNSLEGAVELNLLPIIIRDQEIISKAYRGRISDVLRNNILSKYKFKELDISDTGNNDIWYQPYISDLKFIHTVLLPNAYSNNANNSPFVSYITSDNIFHFKNLNSLINSAPKMTFYYTTNNDDLNQVLLVNNLGKSSNIINNILNNNEIYISRQTGDIVEETVLFTDSPKEVNGRKKILGTYDTSIKKAFNLLGFKDTTSFSENENIRGRIYNKLAPDYFVDRLTFDAPLSKTSLKLKAGDVIEFKTYLGGNQSPAFSQTFSGNYLIEECNHIWLGSQEIGYTNLVVARKFFNPTNNYVLKDILMSK